MQNLFYAARILDRERPLPKVGDTVEIEDRDPNASFIDAADFLEPDECDASSDDDSDLPCSSDDNDSEGE